MSKPIILTGIRSNGELTLGNYLGAMLPLARLQARHAGEYQVNMFVPDLHSFTTPIDHEDLYANTIRNLKMFIASGLNTTQKDTFIYRQSFIPAHAELTWILDCFVYFGELSRMTQFKEKSENQETVSVGLFNYPVLMAADILLYGAKYVPVGEDQRQHLELVRDLAIRMNHQFSENLFIVPEAWDEQLKFAGLNKGVRIRSLKNPDKKMSKSISDPAGTILLSDDPDEAAKKVMSATTDSIGQINYDFTTQPGISNILQIISLLSERSLDEVLAKWQDSTSYGDLKQEAAGLVRDFLIDFQNKVSQIEESLIDEKLLRDEAAMRQVAEAKLLEVQQMVGLRRK